MKFLLLPLLALAAPEQFQIQSQLFLDGKLIASPRIVVNEGQEAMISDSGKESSLTMKMTPTKAEDGKVILSLNVDYLSNRRTVNTKQRIAFRPNETVDLNLGENTSLKMTITKQ